jgi:hypothetical protein
MLQVAIAVGHVVRLEPLPAEHTARSCLQLRPPARCAAAHAVDRTEHDLDELVPRIAQRQDGRPCVGVKYAAVKPFQLVLERVECALQRRGVVREGDILRHTVSCIARLEPTCEVLGASCEGARRAFSALFAPDTERAQLRGRSIVNTQPVPRTSRTSSVPPIAWTARRLIERPRPTPERSSLRCVNGRKSSLAQAGGRPPH